MEKKVIKRTFGYLISRDIWLILLFCTHLLIYFNSSSGIKPVIISALGVATIIWIIFYSRLMIIVIRPRKDRYLKEAFKDEFFINIKLKAGFNAFIGMIVMSLMLITTAILLDTLSIIVSIPLYFACELIILSGVMVDDISKIIMSRG